MTVEIINTGSELLLGQVLNTHLRTFAEALFPLGLRVERQVTVPDGPAIREALEESFTRAEVVLVTGGLGPTTDDITREVTAELLGLTLEHDSEIMQAITERFARRGIAMTERVDRQAQRPREATVLRNPHGTAPGLYLPATATTPHLFLFPGPPRELGPMLRDEAMPILRGIAPEQRAEMRSWRVIGVGESNVEALVGEALLGLGVELGYCARPGEVDVRVIGSADQLRAAEAILREHLAKHIASEDQQPLEQVVVAALAAQGATIATAESCTGGLLAHRLTNVPGASAVFLAGLVTYANEAKVAQLGVEPELIARHGAVSAEVATAMARGAVSRTGARFALATTGIAGPDGGSEAKPVGTVYIALAEAGGEPQAQRYQFPTDRGTFKELTTQTALEWLRQRLAGVAATVDQETASA